MELTSMKLKISERELGERGRVILVILEGDLQGQRVQEFHRRFKRLVESGKRKFILDMGKVGYVDSTGFGTILLAAESLEKDGGKIVLANVNPLLRVPIDKLGLRQYIQVCKDVEEAAGTLER